MSGPVICFGQQPCGFFPNRFVFAKIRTALRLRSKIGGTIVFVSSQTAITITERPRRF